jgi:hypothetical protein
LKDKFSFFSVGDIAHLKFFAGQRKAKLRYSQNPVKTLLAAA